MQDEQHIRQRAYEIWEREGRPDGRHDDHWAQARQEIEEGRALAPAAEASDDISPAVTAPDRGGTTPGQAAADAAVSRPGEAEPALSGQPANAAARGKGRRA